MIYSAESGAVWTLIYPEFSVVVPQDLKARVPLGMVLPPDENFIDFINLWLKVEKTQGNIDSLLEYWVFGKTGKEKQP